jgi:hypothetical protein
VNEVTWLTVGSSGELTVIASGSIKDGKYDWATVSFLRSLQYAVWPPIPPWPHCISVLLLSHYLNGIGTCNVHMRIYVGWDNRATYLQAAKPVSRD